MAEKAITLEERIEALEGELDESRYVVALLLMMLAKSNTVDLNDFVHQARWDAEVHPDRAHGLRNLYTALNLFERAAEMRDARKDYGRE
ncbi:hypothetical protein MZK49_27615 [Ensifer sesbaniae]|uniref:hypothetical protein n=1 Tax=Ensifer sesbaniae TaxID=1214071 RepID=UPI002001A86F|nr:hypothetical protein [Ensifer sesbaniae]